MTSNKIVVIYKKVKDLKKYNNNPKIHTNSHIQKIIDSINEFGWTIPILIDENNIIIAGHGRFEAGLLLGMEFVPCIILANLSESQKRAYLLLDNKLPIDTGFDDDLLKYHLEQLIDDGFDLDLTGFSDDEISKLLDEADTLDIEFDTDNSKGISIKYLSFGKTKMPLSDEEFNNLELISQKYISDYGSSYGFANYLTEGKL